MSERAAERATHRVEPADPMSTDTLLARNIDPRTPASTICRWFRDFSVLSVGIAGDPRTLQRKVSLVALQCPSCVGPG